MVTYSPDGVGRRRAQARGSDVAFGGVQLVLCGDLRQLETIAQDHAGHMTQLIRAVVVLRGHPREADNNVLHLLTNREPVERINQLMPEHLLREAETKRQKATL